AFIPGSTAAIDLFLDDVEMDAPRRHVQLDRVAGFYEGQWATDKTFRRHMQDAGAVARPAHASVRDAHHVAHARLHQFFWNRQHAPFRHTGPALRPGVLEHDDMVGRGGKIVTLDLARHVVVVLERERGPAMFEKAL